MYFVTYGSLSTIGGDNYFQKQLNLAAANDQERRKRAARKFSRAMISPNAGIVASTTTGRSPLGGGRLHIAGQSAHQPNNAKRQVRNQRLDPDRICRRSTIRDRSPSIRTAGDRFRPMTPANARPARRNPTAGLGSYAKSTRLAEPAGRFSSNTTSRSSSRKVGSTAPICCDRNCQSSLKKWCASSAAARVSDNSWAHAGGTAPA